MLDPDTEDWLRALPLGTPVTIDGVEVWLKTFADGAELGAYLLDGCSEGQLQNALRYGFQAAVEFDAGFSLSADGTSLCLSQWLPGVSEWVEAAEPLEKLLDQVDRLLDNMDPARSGQERSEQRMRERLQGRIK